MKSKQEIIKEIKKKFPDSNEPINAYQSMFVIFRGCHG